MEHLYNHMLNRIIVQKIERHELKIVTLQKIKQNEKRNIMFSIMKRRNIPRTH